MANVRYVYQVVDVSGGLWGLKRQKVQDELNRLGAQGWELVTVTRDNGFGVRLFLKRCS